MHVLTLIVWGLAGLAWGSEWADWRGPAGDGTTDEPALTAVPDASKPLWTFPLATRATPVIWGDRAYLWGYTTPDVREVLVAVDLATGRELWRHERRDFMSDIIYDRYSIGAPTVDPETGNVYVLTSAGELVALAPDGAVVWQVSTMETYGRLTFPNGRTGAPLVVEDTVVMHAVTTNWGADGPARDRLYAFDKRSGELVWSSTPGTAPQDSSWSSPVAREEGDGRLVMYVGTGCGHLAAVDGRTGRPIWRAPMAAGGVNMTPAVTDDLVIAAHAVENLGDSKTGGLFAFARRPTTLIDPGDGSPPIQRDLRWRLDLVGFSSSPVVVGDVVYLVTQGGVLTAVDLAGGQVLWEHRLGADQLHASPIFAGGVLYVPMRDGTLWALRVSRAGVDVLGSTSLGGMALGAPALAHGVMVVGSTERVFAFGSYVAGPPPAPPARARAEGPATQLRLRPAEVALRAGEAVEVKADLLDAAGRWIKTVVPEKLERFTPPTAKVKSELAATWDGKRLVAPANVGVSAGAYKGTVGGLTATLRGRTVASLPYVEDFERWPVDAVGEDGHRFGWPPLPWIGARFKWEVHERDGGHVLAKTLDRLLFQRSVVFVGDAAEHDYDMQVDVLSDGDRRQLSAVGVVHQRYIIAIKGNQRSLEVSSNQERLKVAVPFEMKPGVWYRLRTSVRVGDDGVAVIRAKAWPRDEAEPAAWTLETRHEAGHTRGAPGIFGFTPQNLHRVYVDDLRVSRGEEG